MTPQEQKEKNDLTKFLRAELVSSRYMLDTQLSNERGFHFIYKSLVMAGQPDSASTPHLTKPNNGIDLEGWIKKDLAVYEKNVERLEKCKTRDEFEKTFLDIFKVPYNSKKIENYKKISEKQPFVEASKALEDSFSKDFDWLLSGKCDKAIKNNPGYISNNDYEQYANKLANYVGGGDVAKGRQVIASKIKEFCGEEEKNMNHYDKLDAITKYAKFLQGEFHKNTVKEAGGVGYETFHKNMRNAYTSAFGTKNNVFEKVTTYSNTVNTGAMITKSGVLLAMTLATAGGASSVVGASVLMGGETAVISAVDKSIDGHGQLRAMTKDEVLDVLKEAGVAAAFTAGGGSVGHLLSKTGLSQLSQQGIGVATDIAMASGYEKATTGTITIEGVVFNAIFSAGGRLTVLKLAGKPKTKEVPSSKTKTAQPKTAVESQTNKTKSVNTSAKKMSGTELKQQIAEAKPVKTTESEPIHIPKVKLAAPSEKFAATAEAYEEMIYENAYDIAYMNKYITDKTILAKALNKMGNEGMDFVGIEHPFEINNAMQARGSASSDGSNLVEINITINGSDDEFNNVIAELGHRIFHEKHHVYQHIQTSLETGGFEPFELKSKMMSTTQNPIFEDFTENDWYKLLTKDENGVFSHEYKTVHDGRYPANTTNADKKYAYDLLESSTNYTASPEEGYWEQFNETDAEEKGLVVGRAIERVIQEVPVDETAISSIARAAKYAQDHNMDFDLAYKIITERHGQNKAVRHSQTNANVQSNSGQVILDELEVEAVNKILSYYSSQGYDDATIRKVADAAVRTVKEPRYQNSSVDDFVIDFIRRCQID